MTIPMDRPSVRRAALALDLRFKAEADNWTVADFELAIETLKELVEKKRAAGAGRMEGER